MNSKNDDSSSEHAAGRKNDDDTYRRIREYAQTVAKNLPPLSRWEAQQVRHLLGLNR